MTMTLPATTAVTDAADAYPHYAAAFAAQTPPAAPALGDLRRRGWDAFGRLGLPTARRGNEPWKYTNIAPIARAEFAGAGVGAAADTTAGGGVTLAGLQALAPWQPGWHTLAFVDGVFAPGLSSDGNGNGGGGLSVIALSDAAAVGGDGVAAGINLLGELALPDADGFVALNTAFIGDGAVVVVPPDADGGVVNIVYLATRPAAVHPRTLVLAQRNSRLTVVETYAGPDETRYLANAVTEIHAHAGARVEHYRLLLDGRDAYHIGVSRVMQHRDSVFASVSIARGAALGRNDFGVTLAGPGVDCTLNGLYLTTGRQHIDNYINIDHTQPYGASRLFYKGILDGQSRAVFGGNVTVREGAQKTDAQQTDKNLLLSEQAEVDSKPSLLIYADDVKCGHGATAGHIDQDTVFYMRSRGLDLPTAGRILIHAFAREIIDTVALEPLRDYLDAQFQQAIPDADLTLTLGGRS